jgi:hypothetical protein
MRIVTVLFALLFTGAAVGQSLAQIAPAPSAPRQGDKLLPDPSTNRQGDNFAATNKGTSPNASALSPAPGTSRQGDNLTGNSDKNANPPQ